MALAAIKTWIHETLFAADLNAEFANIRNNALTLISPLTGNLDGGGHGLTNVGSISLTSGLILTGPVVEVLDKANVPTTATTTGATDLILEGITAGQLGTTGRLRLTAIGRVSIKANHTVAITSAFLGVSNLAALTLSGGSTTDRGNLSLRLVCEVWMNGSADSQRVSLDGTVAQAAVGLDSPGWGAPGGSNVGINLVDAAISMSVTRTLQIYASWSNADASNSLSLYQFILEQF